MLDLSMLEPEVQEAILDSQVEARESSHKAVHSVHVLAVLLESDQFEVVSLMRGYDLTADQIRIENYRLLPRLEGTASSTWRPPFSMKVQRAINATQKKEAQGDADLQIRRLLQTMIIGKKGAWSSPIVHALKRREVDVGVLGRALEAQPA